MAGVSPKPPPRSIRYEQELSPFFTIEAKYPVTLIGVDPDLFIGYWNLASNYLAMGRLEDADRALRRASERKLDEPNFAWDRYEIAFLRGDEAGMMEAASAVEKIPGAGQWMIDREAVTLAYSGHLHQARETLRRAGILARQSPIGAFAAGHEAQTAMLEAYFGNTKSAQLHALAALNSPQTGIVSISPHTHLAW